MFNEEQQKAIETIKGQLILVACPGSGKTTTLLGRIHEMIQQGVPAENILMVTFTTAAAGEMKQRFWKKYAEDGMVTFCTIHSFCLATLKKFAHFDAECVLATGDIYEFFFQQLVRHKEIVDKVEYIKALLLDIAVCKNSMCPLAQFEPNCGEKELFDELFKAYENWKDALGKIDYDDMLLKAYELMKNDKTCLEWLQERYQYIQIDEFQDTNYLQRDILYGNVIKVYGYFNKQDEESFSNELIARQIFPCHPYSNHVFISFQSRTEWPDVCQSLKPYLVEQGHPVIFYECDNGSIREHLQFKGKEIFLNDDVLHLKTDAIRNIRKLNF